MNIINIGFTPKSVLYLLTLVDRDRQETAEIAFASNDKEQYKKANELQNFKTNILTIAEQQGFDLQSAIVGGGTTV